MLTYTARPNLHGLWGRKTGEVEGYSYSDANKGKGIHWGDDTLVSLLSHPHSRAPADSALVRVPREPQEVHSRYQDGLRWLEEGQGPQRPVRILQTSTHELY
jgi:hypothetical protein